MTYRIGKCRFLTVENVVRKIISLKCVTKKIFALAVLVELLFGIDRHNVFYKIKIAERNTGFKAVDRNTAVGTKNIVHMKLTDSLLRFFLELLGRRSKIRVFVSEKLVGNFTRQKNTDIGVLVNPFTKQIHTH